MPLPITFCTRAAVRAATPIAWTLLSLCWAVPAQALVCQVWEGDDTQALEGKPIGSITVVAADIFNPALQSENRWLHRLANNLHYQTRRETVARQLLFAEGGSFSQRELDETERLLRARGYLAEADIRVTQLCGDEVWIQVRTIDTWSTVPEISLSRVAGENQRKISLEENNLFGRGQELAFSYEENPDRVSRSLSYRRNDLGGKRRTLGLELQNNEDGERYQLSLTKPFFSMSDTSSWALVSHFDRRSTTLYEAGEIAETMGMEQHYLDLSSSWSNGLQDGLLNRWALGVRVDDRSFYTVDDSVSEVPFANRRDRYPYVRLEHIEENFVEIQHIRQLAITEDINLGTQYSVELGYGARAWGANNDGLHLRLNHQRGLRWKERSLLLADSWVSAHLADGDWQQQRIGSRAQLHTRLSAKNQFFVGLMFDSGHALNPEEQLVIGGDSGLRGYAFKAQSGNRVASLSTELRHYPDWNPWHLLRFGAAFFIDYGSAWRAGGEGPDWLWDVGLGLRLASSRSSSGKVLHLDFAAPEGKGSPQWTATAKVHF